jgi:hypothetical protein
MISLRPPLITEHHSVSNLNDPAREALPCSRQLRPACDVDTTCTVVGNVHESMATKVRAHRAPNLLRGCVGRSDRSRIGQQVEGDVGFKSTRPDFRTTQIAQMGDCRQDLNFVSRVPCCCRYWLKMRRCVGPLARQARHARGTYPSSSRTPPEQTRVAPLLNGIRRKNGPTSIDG